MSLHPLVGALDIHWRHRDDLANACRCLTVLKLIKDAAISQGGLANAAIAHEYKLVVLLLQRGSHLTPTGTY